MAKEKKKALAKAAAASPTTASTQSSWSLDDLFTPQGALLAVGFCFFLSGAFKTLNGLYNEIRFDMREQVLPPHLLSSAELDRIHATLSGDKFAFFGGWRKNITMLGGMNRALVNGEHIILEEFFDVELATKYRAELKSGHAKGWFKGEGPIAFEATGIDMAAYADVGPAKRCQTFRELHEKGGAFQFKYHAAQPHAEGASATLGVSIDKTPAISRVTRSMRSRSFIDAFGMLLSGQPAPTGFRFNDPTVRVFAPGDYTLLHTDRTSGGQNGLSQHRALCMNYYLTESDWHSEWGGGFLWCGAPKAANESSSNSAKAEETEAVRLVPGFNRANLFVPTKSTSWHAVEVVEPEATGLRLSFTSWMALPAGW